MAFCIVRGSDALARNTHKVGVQFSVRILIVKDRHGVGAWSDAGKIADRMPIGDDGRGAGDSLVSFLRKIISRGKEGAKNLALVIAQSDNLDVDLVLLRRLRLREGRRRK